MTPKLNFKPGETCGVRDQSAPPPRDLRATRPATVTPPPARSPEQAKAGHHGAIARSRPEPRRRTPLRQRPTDPQGGREAELHVSFQMAPEERASDTVRREWSSGPFLVCAVTAPSPYTLGHNTQHMPPRAGCTRLGLITSRARARWGKCNEPRNPSCFSF